MPPDLPRFTRREALAGLAGASGALALSGTGALAQAPMCVLTPEATEGPFYFDPKLLRADIAEGRPGAPMRLALRLVQAGPCTPIEGARIDVWHSDAAGAYSGYRGQSDSGSQSTVGATFLRGTQVTGGNGEAAFRTIYPGWYPGRTPHIHFKVILENRDAATSQLYFPDEVSDKVFARPPYNMRAGRRQTTNRNDGVLRGTRNPEAVMASVREEGETFVASLTIGVAGPGRSNAPVAR